VVIDPCSGLITDGKATLYLMLDTSGSGVLQFMISAPASSAPLTCSIDDNQDLMSCTASLNSASYDTFYVKSGSAGYELALGPSGSVSKPIQVMAMAYTV